VEALSHLRLVGKIKRAYRDDVVNMPTVQAVIFPGHPLRELRLKVISQGSE
jgi:hypothetical protein